jgi:glucokinase
VADDTPWLIADVGGTNIRLALADGPGAKARRVIAYQDAEHPTLEAAIAAYLAAVGERPRAACIAIAGPVVGTVLQLTNRGWQLDRAALAGRFGWARLLVINDFEALALALPSLEPDVLAQIGGGSPLPGKPKAVLGPGTGLGVGGLVPGAGGRWIALASEGGHAGFAPFDERDLAVLGLLQRRYGRVSAERVLSGPGLAALYEALTELHGAPRKAPSPDKITHAALAGEDAPAAEALELFCAALGSFAGDVALTLGAQGGVYIGGGIAPRIIDVLRASRFRARFEHKGRIRPMVAGIPTWVILDKLPALPGAVRALEQG